MNCGEIVMSFLCVFIGSKVEHRQLLCDVRDQDGNSLKRSFGSPACSPDL